MAIVSAEVRFAPQLTAWFTANPTKVLQNGEIVYCSDGANVGKYVIGDNSTQLSALTFYGGISASGLTVGATTITGGTSGRVMYNNAGVVGEYAVTGTGTTAVLSVSPVFGTDITTPLIYGGTGSGGNITIQSTTNATKGKILFGTSGYDEVNNRLGIGTSSPSQLIHVSTTTAGQGILSGNVFVGVAKNLTTNYAEFSHNSSPQYALAQLNTGQTFFNGITSCTFNVGTNAVMTLTDRRVNVNPAAITSGAQNTFTITVPANTGQTASTNISNFTITGNTKTWAGGAGAATLATEYFNYISANTVAFANANTATHVSNFRVDAPLQGTNATATNLYAIDCGGHMFIANSVGVPSNNPTGGGILYVEGGALKYRSSNGTVTTVGPL